MMGKLWVRKADKKFRTLLSDLEEEFLPGVAGNPPGGGTQQNLGEKFAGEN